MRNPKDFFKPMAIGAPEPAREIPFRPSRMIHFFDPSNPKMAAKAPSIAAKCDVLLGNLEDAIQAGNYEQARAAFSAAEPELRAAARRRGNLRPAVVIRAGDGNRTRVISLEG